MIRGKYIVIEGHDGTGKSTQVELLQAKLLSIGITSVVYHEPGGTPIADEIRTIIKNGDLPRSPMTNLLLFTAARYEIWQDAKTHLARGIWALSARNYYSTLAYQGYGEGMDTESIIQITKMHTDTHYMKPDWSAILTLDSHNERTRRMKGRGSVEHPDTFESRGDSFQMRVADGYREVARRLDVPLVDASPAPDVVAAHIFTRIQHLIA